MQKKKNKTLPSKNTTQQGYHSESKKKHFPDKQKLKEFIITKLALQDKSNGFLQAAKEGHQLVARKHIKVKTLLGKVNRC